MMDALASVRAANSWQEVRELLARHEYQTEVDRLMGMGPKDLARVREGLYAEDSALFDYLTPSRTTLEYHGRYTLLCEDPVSVRRGGNAWTPDLTRIVRETSEIPLAPEELWGTRPLLEALAGIQLLADTVIPGRRPPAPPRPPKWGAGS